jgi:bifunctional non-homologous end joining protein LigD
MAGGLSGLHLADHAHGALRYAGRVGSGFSDAELGRVRAILEADRRPEPACGGPVPKGRDNVWVEPRLVCEVRYLERTKDGLLRQPVFLRFRDDKALEECLREGADGDRCRAQRSGTPSSSAEDIIRACLLGPGPSGSLLAVGTAPS